MDKKATKFCQPPKRLFTNQAKKTPKRRPFERGYGPLPLEFLEKLGEFQAGNAAPAVCLGVVFFLWRRNPSKVCDNFKCLATGMLNY